MFIIPRPERYFKGICSIPEKRRNNGRKNKEGKQVPLIGRTLFRDDGRTIPVLVPASVQ